MDDVPPYSPTVASSERRLPNDYYAHNSEDDDDVMRPKPATATAARRGARLSLVSSSPSAPLEDQYNALRPIATAPPTLSLFPLEPPPEYAPVDALASSFRLEAPLIYATRTSNTPRYQLMQKFSRSGKPRELLIRRLLPSEMRADSLRLSSLASKRRLRYDEESTMYAITTYDMRGYRSSTLAGRIKLETGISITGTRWTKFWQYTRNAKRDSLNPENEARIQKYGYRADEEWDKRLLFCVKKGVWEDKEGRRAALEGEEFRVLGEVSAPKRDLLVSCWMMRLWMGEGLRWEGD